jgi:hypothetical protein
MKTALLLLIGACATAPTAPTPQVTLKEVAASDVQACRSLGEFTSTSAQPGEAGMAAARAEAREKAAAAGANVIVVGSEWQSPDVASAAVKAYDCK